MKIRVTNETKTGILVLVSLVVFGALILKVGNFGFFQKGYSVKCQLHYSAGVKKHAPVRLSGVDVGEVKDIRILYGDQTIVELVLWFREGVKLRLDSKAYVTTLGLMGEKYIEIKAGTAAAEYAKEGDLIPGQDPLRLEDFIETATKRLIEQNELVDESEMVEIRGNAALNRSIRRGQADARSKRGRFVD